MPNETAAPTQVTLASLRQQEAPEARMPVVRTGMMDLQGFELMQRVGKALAASTLVPKQYQGNLPNCLIALEMAQRIGASPLMVCQNLYVVHGNPGWSAKFLIATFNQCGRFAAIRYRWQGTAGKDDWGCRAYSKELSTGDEILGPLIDIALSKKEGWYAKTGSKWQTIPELMLMYRSAAWMINTHAPEISMGLRTAEEIGDVYDASRGTSGEFEVTTGELRQGLPALPADDGTVVDPPDPLADATMFTLPDLVAKMKNAVNDVMIDEIMDLARDLTEDERMQLSKEAVEQCGRWEKARK